VKFELRKLDMKENNDMRAVKARMVLEAAHSAWASMSEFRSRRRRYLRYTYGDQWGDTVCDRSGHVSTEGEAMKAAGGKPLTNNLIRRMVKAVVGRYRRQADSDGTAPDGDATAEKLAYWHTFNCTDELDARSFEEFLISGVAIQRVGRDVRQGRHGVWVDIVDPDRFFISGMRDLRGCDVELVGRLIDMSVAELCMRFAGADVRRARKLKTLYATLNASGSLPRRAPLGPDKVDFFHAPDGRCRVAEVWTLECREKLRCHDPLNATMFVLPAGAETQLDKLNRRRRREGLPPVEWHWEPLTAWHCRMMAPDATVLAEYDSPLTGGIHPFAVKLYPLVDGDVHSLVEDVLDQQRHVNRLITTMDRMMSTAAKGVLMFPVKSKIDGLEWEDVARLWADPGGVIPYRPSENAEPHQVVTPVADMGINQLLKTQIEMFQDVSGVSDALMGRNISAGIGVERFNREVENASVAVNDLLKTFSHFVKMRDELICKAV